MSNASGLRPREDRAAAPRSRLFVEAAQFIGLSGLGWLLDFLLLLLLVRFLKLPVFQANLVSASTAGLFVFFASRTMVFRPAHGSAAGRALFYLAYTITVILLASACMRLLVGVFHASSVLWMRRPVIAAALAKVLVTPLNLALNFVVARGVNTFGKQKVKAA